MENDEKSKLLSYDKVDHGIATSHEYNKTTDTANADHDIIAEQPDFNTEGKKSLKRLQSFGSEQVKLSFEDLTYTVTVNASKEEIDDG